MLFRCPLAPTVALPRSLHVTTALGGAGTGTTGGGGGIFPGIWAGGSSFVSHIPEITRSA